MRNVRTIDSNNTIFAGRTPCERYNIIQRNNCLELVFDEDGIFRINNRRILLTGFRGAYSFDIEIKSNCEKIVTDISETIKLMGRKKKGLTMPKIFPKFIPCWDKAVSKSKNWGFKEKATERVIEYYNFNEFEGFVLYDSSDPTLPDYKSLTKLFGKTFKYLGSSIRFKPGKTSINDIITNVLNKNKNEYVVYQTSNGDFIITEDKYENILFRTLELSDDKTEEYF